MKIAYKTLRQRAKPQNFGIPPFVVTNEVAEWTYFVLLLWVAGKYRSEYRVEREHFAEWVDYGGEA